ncbi:MAG: CYTH domain-containing protein [Nitrospirae bacterium]|nr:MAG: CYTH domain-containing protein [Nitrospirota bacterium]
MHKEIERKFLVKDGSWRTAAGSGTTYLQGYISVDEDRTVRVRTDGTRGYITLKGRAHNITRNEFEYEIPADDAIRILNILCIKPLIKKVRYLVKHKNFIWEIDVFEDENKGLVIAEIELTDENESFAIPDWAGAEVTSDTRYLNSNLVKRPFSEWIS